MVPLLAPTQLPFFLAYLLWLPQMFLYSDTPQPRPPSFRLAQAIFQTSLLPYKYANNIIPVIPLGVVQPFFAHRIDLT